jgi:TonB family protein
MIATIVECAVRAGALAFVIWLMLFVLRVRSPRLERQAWLAVLALAIAMPLLIKVSALMPVDAPSLPWVQELGAVASLPANHGWPLRAILLGLLAVGNIVLLARQIVGLVRLWHVRRHARPVQSPQWKGSDVRVSLALNAPATVFSTILVPADFEGMTAEAQRAILAHERAHVTNRDFYVQCLAQLHRSVFWFSPLAWWLPRRLALLSEHISDDAAIGEMEERTTYAELLLAFAARATNYEQAVAMARTATLATRIERILGEEHPLRDGRTKAVLLALSVLLVVAAVVGFRSATSQVAGGPQLTLRSGFARGSDPAVHAAAPTFDTRRIVLPRSNPAMPLSQPMYPSASRRLQEQGTVILKLHVLEDGSIADAIIDQSTGYPDLDYAALYQSFRWRLEPGTVDGAPSRMWGRFAVTFKLE